MKEVIKEAQEIINKKYINSYEDRSKIVDHLCWFYPSVSNFEMLKSLTVDSKGVLDIGCGSGIVGKYISDDYHGIRAKIYGVDEVSYIDNIKEIIREDLVGSLRNSAQDTWLLIWPPYSNKMATVVYNEFLKNQNAKKLVYVGEPAGGCNGDEEFSDILDELMFDEHKDLNIKEHFNWDSYDSIRDICLEIIKR